MFQLKRVRHAGLTASPARTGGPGGGAWLAFRDDQLTTYWYNLRDKVVTQANPYLGA